MTEKVVLELKQIFGTEKRQILLFFSYHWVILGFFLHVSLQMSQIHLTHPKCTFKNMTFWQLLTKKKKHLGLLCSI